jgi:hypothetical protein
MINHTRTLLANLSGSPTGFVDYPGEEYIPPKFSKLNLGNLAAVYRVLFSDNPDRVFVNYRTRQLMSVVHNSELREYVEYFDSRVTYDPTPTDELFYDLFQFAVNDQLSAGNQLYLQGDQSPATVNGRCYQEWKIEVLTANTVRVSRQAAPVSESILEYTTESDLSSMVPLAGSEFNVRFEPAVGAIWFVSGYARPSKTLQQIEDGLKSIGEPLLIRVFQSTTLGRLEPIKTFLKVWETHPELPNRLAAFLLAYTFRLESLRKGER